MFGGWSVGILKRKVVDEIKKSVSFCECNDDEKKQMNKVKKTYADIVREQVS